MGRRSPLIDLHSHTNESDGSLSPAQLISEAAAAGVRVLGITDHDTFAGYEKALPFARESGIELICGIELSTKLYARSVHLLGYFLSAHTLDGFRQWVAEMQESRRERNVRLAARLRDFGFEITIEEAEARGRGMTGRPHFAQIMVEKGYVANYRQAFDQYLDESAKAYVYRREPQLTDSIQKIRAAGGIASLAHPARVNGDVPALLPELCDAGLNAIEAYHSDHGAEETRLYLGLSEHFGLKVTGGSDFHGEVKPEVKLGTGCDGNLKIPADLMDRLRDP